MSEAPFSIDFPISPVQMAAIIIGQATSQPALEVARLSFNGWQRAALNVEPREVIWENAPPYSIPTTSWSGSERSGDGRGKIPTPAEPTIEASCSFWSPPPTPLAVSWGSSGSLMDVSVPVTFVRSVHLAPAPASRPRQPIGDLFRTTGHRWLRGFSWFHLGIGFWLFVVFSVFPNISLDWYILVLSSTVLFDGIERFVSQ